MHKIAFGLLCAMVFCIPWENAADTLGFPKVIFFLAWVTFAVAGLAIMSRNKVRRPPMAFMVLGLSVAWTILSVLWSVDPDESLKYGKTFVMLFLFAWTIQELCNSQDRVLWLFRAYVLGCGVSLAHIFIAYAQNIDIYFKAQIRYSGGGLNANDLATVLSISIPMAAHLASSTRRTLARTLYWTFVPIASMGVFLTGSRSGTLSLAASLILTAVTLRVKGRRAVIALLVSSCFAAFLIPRLVSQQVFSRLAEGRQAHNFQRRVAGWETGLSYWSKHPLLGCGSGSYAATVKRMGGESLVAHNTFVSVLVEGGLIGFALMATFWFLLVRMVIAMGRQERLLWLTIFAVWTIGSMALSWGGTKSTWLIYACAMAHHATLRQSLSLRSTESA